jgi:arylsulfatase A-like enzyme
MMWNLRRLGYVSWLWLTMVAASVAAAESQPNVLIILADDLGFSDLGCYGSEIATPNLDALAKDGLRFSQFYNTARCWPSRGALMTGYYAQTIRRDTVPGVPSGGRGVRPAWAELMPARLHDLGYRCYHTGKWHIDGKALENGFDHSYMIQDQGRFFGPKVHFEDDVPQPAVQPDTGFYATRVIADHAVQFLKDHAAQHADQPFFHYLAFTCPHFPLHALPEDIAKYQQVYQKGWDVIREARWQKMKKEGLPTSELPPLEQEVGPAVCLS